MTANIKKGPALGQRHVQAFLLFACIAVNYMTKYNASVSVVAMTNADTTNPDYPEYDWGEREKSYILSSFFWGYVITQFPAGYMCRRFGVKMTLFISTLGSSLATLLLPFVVDWGDWQIFCVIRVIQGLFQGLDLPCVHAHLAVWSPVEERNRLGALASSGIECGTVLAMLLSGIIATSSMGWPGISYISCGIGLVWCALWLIAGADSPSGSKFISNAELQYIETSIHATKSEDEEQSATTTKNQIPVPWKSILTSRPFWALLIVRSAVGWSFSTVQGEIPTYMNSVLGMDMKSNTLYSALPYIALWCLSYVYLILADIILNRKMLTLNTVRKSFNTIAFWIPAACLIAVGFVDADQQTLAVVLLVASVGINSGCTIGSALNTIDLSPNHAGILMSVINASASICPILTPLVVGAIVNNESDPDQWQIVFAICAVILFVCNLIYIVFGSTELQEWDHPNFLKPKVVNNEDDANIQIIEKSEEIL